MMRWLNSTFVKRNRFLVYSKSKCIFCEFYWSVYLKKNWCNNKIFQTRFFFQSKNVLSNVVFNSMWSHFIFKFTYHFNGFFAHTLIDSIKVYLLMNSESGHSAQATASFQTCWLIPHVPFFYEFFSKIVDFCHFLSILRKSSLKKLHWTLVFASIYCLCWQL